MEDHRRQFALRLLGEKVDPSFRRRSPRRVNKKTAQKAMRRQKQHPVSAKPGVKNRQIRLLFLQHVL